MYTTGQKREMAHEVAKAGGILSQAVDSLKCNYETFDKVGLTTLRRYMQDGGFRKMVREEERLLSRAGKQARSRIEESRSELASLGPEDIDRIAREALRTLHTMAKKSNDPHCLEMMLRYMEFLDRRRSAPKVRPFRPEDL